MADLSSFGVLVITVAGMSDRGKFDGVSKLRQRPTTLMKVSNPNSNIIRVEIGKNRDIKILSEPKQDN